MLKPLVALLAVFAVFALYERPAHAQQTLFNHPSADVLERGAAYLELDATHRLQRGFEGLVARAVVGPVSPVEVGLNVGPFFGDGSGGELTLTPNAKVRPFSLSSDAGVVSSALGTRVYVPLSLTRPSLELYGLVAWAAPFGLRVAAGAYGTAARAASWTGDGGLTASAELNLFDRVTLAVEWWRARDLCAGVIVPLPGGFTLYAAWLFSPQGRAGDGAIAEIGWTHAAESGAE